jgi:hypothetical protein
MSKDQHGGNYRYSDEEGFVWQNDGKYKNMLDLGTMWYARISFILFIVTVVVLIVCLLKVDGDVDALKKAIVAKRSAFWNGTQTTA